MKIFTNELLQENKIDFTRWETTNGDYVTISDVGSGYIERNMDMLGSFIERYPSHVNYPIWQRYMKAFEDEVISRDDLEHGRHEYQKEKESLYQTAKMIG